MNGNTDAPRWDGRLGRTSQTMRHMWREEGGGFPPNAAVLTSRQRRIKLWHDMDALKDSWESVQLYLYSLPALPNEYMMMMMMIIMMMMMSPAAAAAERGGGQLNRNAAVEVTVVRQKRPKASHGVSLPQGWA